MHICCCVCMLCVWLMSLSAGARAPTTAWELKVPNGGQVPKTWPPQNQAKYCSCTLSRPGKVLKGVWIRITQKALNAAYLSRPGKVLKGVWIRITQKALNAASEDKKKSPGGRPASVWHSERILVLRGGEEGERASEKGGERGREGEREGGMVGAAHV
jgi:hypothetical protein